MKIKTRDSMRTIKTLDRAGTFADQTKGGLSEANRQATDVDGGNYNSATDYAGQQVTGTEGRIARTTIYGGGKIGRWGIRETRKNLRNRKIAPKKKKMPKSKRLSAPKRTALQSGKKAVKGIRGFAQKAKAVANATVKFTKAATKTIVSAVKATAAAIKSIAAAIAAGGWIAILIILFVCLLGGLIAFVYTPFLPNDEGGAEIDDWFASSHAEYEQIE